MKIVHIMLCGPVTDGWSYQDNMLTKYHRKNGYDVTIITSQWMWNKNGILVKDERNIYINENDVKVIRLPIKSDFPLNYKFKRYRDLIYTLKKEAADILFIHGCQFMDIWKIERYLTKHRNVKVYLDNHADFSNSGKNIISRTILHGLIWKKGIKKIEPYVTKFYGVLPARVEFLKNVYSISPDKIEWLPLGADDEIANEVDNIVVTQKTRQKLDIDEDEFVLITGGKIDYAKKQTLLLIKAVSEMDNVKLIVFGTVDNNIKEEFYKLLQNTNNVIYLGWLDSKSTYPYIAMSNLAVFPGRHSVLWEQAAGQGIPIICKYWEGTTHIDMGGNVKYIMNDSVETIKQVIQESINQYDRMSLAAKGKAKDTFRYNAIAQKSIISTSVEKDSK